MSDSRLAQIAHLEQLTLPQLRGRWRELVGPNPPRYSRPFLLRRLAHRLQELAHGGLSHATRSRMEALLADAGCDELGRLPRRGQKARGRRELPVSGTRLMREWQGERHEVTAVQGGFAYGGRRYRSLTAIAQDITGTHWNGPAFFGLRGSEQQERVR